ncbi:hypothetical protein [Sphingomonas hengshuiensis]|uniref:Uncharacterized protein n=1 Tax=Sphingomonas hengshuiensis TaxID=1609977 RepID=A0A7U4J8K0_9SPHN|nr:hypothetical protein [Sphingomonas hengshuiensis]AJP72226.1 hypothetical protein TS85_11140 [Sphingomonas hengshuiensis]
MRAALIALAASTAAASPSASPPHAAETHAAEPAAKPSSQTPTGLPFAAELAQQPAITGPAAWHGDIGATAWAKLAKAKPERRQQTRWNYAVGLIAAGRGPEALGVLDTMRTGDRDLMLVPQFQLARGVALALADHHADALAALETAELAGNPEACTWRMRAHAALGEAVEAVRTINCALPAINARSRDVRAPFVLAAAEAAIAAGQPQPALAWLKLFEDNDSAANALRGRALLALGKLPEGTLRLERALRDADATTKPAIQLALLESRIATHRLPPADAIKQLEVLRYSWRGGETEERALRLQFKLANEAHDLRGSLRAGATLLRWFKLGAESAPMLAALRAMLSATLGPDSGVPLPEAAGLYWDYRELAPAGVEGDALVLRLADRLEAAGLYARAAELLEYQLMQRMQDVAQGPMSVKVAELHILAGKPERAIQALHDTEQPSYSDAMRRDRKRMEAVALHRMGKDEAAMAALDDVGDDDALRAEIQWRAKNWAAFASANEARLPAPRGLSEPSQAAVLRQAVALAMLGREDALKALRARYAAGFAKLPSAEAFDVLTQGAASVDPARIAAAMAAIPEASPAGEIGDLLDATQ